MPNKSDGYWRLQAYDKKLQALNSWPIFTHSLTRKWKSQDLRYTQ